MVRGCSEWGGSNIGSRRSAIRLPIDLPSRRPERVDNLPRKLHTCMGLFWIDPSGLDGTAFCVKMPNRERKMRDMNKRNYRVASVLLALVGVLSYTGCGQKAPRQKPTAEQPDDKQDSPVVKSSVEKTVKPRVDPKRLVGRWLRHDGGYTIAIKGVSKGGALSAAYFNPNPINVETATFSHDGTKLKVFIKLQDKGYPGSIYDLVYDPENDVLIGKYFLAAQRQEFPVGFQRTPERK